MTEQPQQPTALDKEDQRNAMLDRIMKASAAEGGDQISNLRSREEEVFSDAGAFPPPWPIELLARIAERSSALRPCIDAMVVNVHGYDHRLVPTLDLSDKQADRLIAESILSERIFTGEEDEPEYPTPQEVATRKAEIERGMVLERLRLETFFANVAGRIGWMQLKQQVWNDYEATGNGYMEVVRDRVGRIKRINYAPSTHIRLRKLSEPVWVSQRNRISSIAFADEEGFDRFRSYVQSVSGMKTFFKEFGDPRPMDSRTGRYYNSVEEMPVGAIPATELLHFWVFSSRSSYGVPRWVGATFEVLGIKAAAEMNYTHWDNKAIPPLAILVSGGKLTAGAAQQIATHVESRIKGRNNYHAALVIEAEPFAGSSGNADARARIALQPIAQPQDGIFLQYSDQSEDVIARQFRISPITRGKTKDFNRATAESASRKDETQVFQPERQKFDQRFERTILTDMGIRYWRVVSNSPTASDPETLSKIVSQATKDGNLVPDEARRFLSDVLNVPLAQLEAKWSKQPLALTLAGIPVEEDDPRAGSSASMDMAAMPGIFRQVVALRDLLASRAREDNAMADDDARREDASMPVETIRVPAELMQKWIMPDEAA
ncbi:phage portal protein [Candidatus Dependentiae bacterium]|nr:MAG: phage portal protein [Candidatus Dependentiae bacterium]